MHSANKTIGIFCNIASKLDMQTIIIPEVRFRGELIFRIIFESVRKKLRYILILEGKDIKIRFDGDTSIHGIGM